MEKPSQPSKTSSTDNLDAERKENSEVGVASVQTDDPTNGAATLVPVPLSFKIASILLVSAIGFGSSWSGGITGAMKSTLKKVIFLSPRAENPGF